MTITLTVSAVNADPKPERAPIESRSTLVWKLLGRVAFVHRLAGVGPPLIG